MTDKPAMPTALLTDAEFGVVKGRQGPQKPGRCAGGVKLPRGDALCTDCGAGPGDTCGKWVREATADLAALLSHAEAQAKRIGELEGALKPFADAGALAPSREPDENGMVRCPDTTPVITLGNSPGPYARVDYGDLRRAAAALTPKTQQK